MQCGVTSLQSAGNIFCELQDEHQTKVQEKKVYESSCDKHILLQQEKKESAFLAMNEGLSQEDNDC